MFAPLNVEHLQDLACLLQPAGYMKGGIIIPADEAGNRFFFVSKGKVKAIVDGDGGRKESLFTLKDSDMLGDRVRRMTHPDVPPWMLMAKAPC